MKDPNAPVQYPGGKGGAGWPPVLTEADHKRQVDLASRSFKAAQAQVASLNKAKPSTKDKKAYARWKAQYDTAQKNLARAQSELNKANAGLSKYYTSTGQYEKLLKGESRDAFLAVNALFKSYGLESLAGKIYDYVKNGYSADTISILLQDSKEYKQRFSGNEIRKQAGLPVLSAGEYLATEASFRQIMQSAGLPPGYYDQQSDFAGWIGQNTSPSEIQSRVDLATQATILANPDYRKALNQIGIDDAHLTAYFLDPTKSLPFLQKAAATAAVGAGALAQGLTFDKGYAEQLALSGVSADQAREGYSQVASELDTMKNLGKIYGADWSQRTSEEAIFQGSAEAIQKKARLLSQERGQFGSATGAGRGGLAQGGGAR